MTSPCSSASATKSNIHTEVQIDLAGKTILVTGGTSTLGFTIVNRALQEKASVFFTYFQNESKAQELVSAGAKAIKTDLRKLEDVDRLKEVLKKNAASLDGLVNNAGTVRDHTIGNLTGEEFDEVLDVNLTAVFRITKRLIPLLYKSSSAKIINIASRVGMRGGFGESNYAAAKAGVVAFTKSLASEVGRKGICVNAVAPGFMMSRMTANLPEIVYEKQKQESYLESFADPLEAANFIIYLLSDLVKGVTGQLFYFDSRKTRVF